MAYITEAKSCPCTDCGVTFPSICMDFDHLGGEVVRPMAQFASNSLERIQLEIDKCEVVCSNCHRIRHLERDAYKAAGRRYRRNPELIP